MKFRFTLICSVLSSFIALKTAPADSVSPNVIGVPLDSSAKSTKDLPATPPPEESEILESNNFHNLDDEIRNRDILDTGANDDIAFNHSKGGCDVLKDGYVEVALDPHDILKTQELVYAITPAELRLYFKGSLDHRADRNAKEAAVQPKRGRLFARFSFNAIVTPLETTTSARECFRMFYRDSPIIFCGSDIKAREYVQWIL